MKILIIAPHSDDEVLGCGGTIAKHTIKGDEVALCIVTKGYTPDWSEEFMQKRQEQIKMSCEILGISKIYLMNYPTAKLDTIPQKELNQALKEVISDFKPDMMFIPHKGDLNKDHRLIFEAALVAARPIEHKIKKILVYETLSETEWGQAIELFIPNVYVDITDTFAKKKEAMQAYENEIKPAPHPRSMEVIEALAVKRGSEAGMMKAEAFMLIREMM